MLFVFWCAARHAAAVEEVEAGQAPEHLAGPVVHEADRAGRRLREERLGTRARGPAFNGKGSKVFAEELDDGSTTKVGLPSPDDANEYDVVFEDGPLGFRLEERGGLVAVSLVTSVDAAGPAAAAGVRAGDVVLGVNGERYLSHAHTAATLKHGRRPVELRLRHSD